MKKLLAFALVLMIVAMSLVGAFAEEEESRFEKALIQKGSLIMKEFTDCTSFETELSNMNSGNFNFDICIQTAVLTDLETNEKYYALRLVTTDYRGGDFVETVGVLDADEIDEVITTLEYIKEHKDEMKDYSEIVYTAASGLVIGAYKSSENAGLTVKINATSTTNVELNKLEGVIKAFQNAKEKLEEIQS